MYVRLADQNILQPQSIPVDAVARAENVRLGQTSPMTSSGALVLTGAIILGTLLLGTVVWSASSR